MVLHHKELGFGLGSRELGWVQRGGGELGRIPFLWQALAPVLPSYLVARRALFQDKAVTLLQHRSTCWHCDELGRPFNLPFFLSIACLPFTLLRMSENINVTWRNRWTLKGPTFVFFFISNFYCYSITVVCMFSPSLHPTPANPTSLSHLYPPP